MMGTLNLNAWQLFLAGGPLMWPIALCSVFCLAVILEKLLQFYRFKIDGRNFLNILLDNLSRNKIKEAINLCDAKEAPLAHILKAGILKHDRPRQEIEQAIEDAYIYELPKLEKGLGALSAISQICPLLGFLGSAIGMVICFQAIQLKSNALNPISPGDLAAGIWQALLATIAGLLVAIPAYLAYHYFVNRIKNIVAEAQIAATELVNFLSQWSKPLEPKELNKDEI